MEKIQFSPLIIGAMRLGKWGAELSTDELERFIDECMDMGLQDMDHADIYGHYTEEGHFGEVIGRRPDLKQKLRITTKCGIRMVSDRRPGNQIKSYDSTAAHIIWSAENSLKELNIDQIELLLLHRPDSLLNPQEVAEAFEKLRQAGKVRYFGVSNYSTSQFDLLNSFTPLVTNQVEHSLLHLDALYDGTLDQCLRLGIQPTAWSPFGGGLVFSKSEDSRITRIQKVGNKLGEKYGASLDQVLMAWITKHPARIVPVLGTSKISRVKAALEADRIELSHEEWYELLEASVGKEVP